jgi:dihydroorotate dehydrogenase
VYGLARSFLFRFDPETAHHLAFGMLDRMGPLAHLAAFPAARALPSEAMGIQFPNPVGLAAGLDKNGDHIETLARMGFGFLEIGTITPRPQPGNPKPRMFRLVEHEALINRLGFNNRGLPALIDNVRRSRFVRDGGVLGINIGKNFDTPNNKAKDDYLACLEAVYDYATYVTVNISSPNTKNLRELQKGNALDGLLTALAKRRDKLARARKRRVPIVLKIAPDLSQADVNTMMASVIAHEFDGVIATNTTISRPPEVAEHRFAAEQGGLSGAPLAGASDQVLTWVVDAVAGKIPIIGVGGIVTGDAAVRKMANGASLVQIYTGFIYHGPALIADSIDSIRAHWAANPAAVRDQRVSV